MKAIETCVRGSSAFLAWFEPVSPMKAIETPTSSCHRNTFVGTGIANEGNGNPTFLEQRSGTVGTGIANEGNGNLNPSSSNRFTQFEPVSPMKAIETKTGDAFIQCVGTGIANEGNGNARLNVILAVLLQVGTGIANEGNGNITIFTTVKLSFGFEPVSPMKAIETALDLPPPGIEEVGTGIANEGN